MPGIELGVVVRTIPPDAVPAQAYAGWLSGSSCAGAPGGMVVTGHVDEASAVICRLRDVRPGGEARVAGDECVSMDVAPSSTIVPETTVDVLY